MSARCHFRILNRSDPGNSPTLYVDCPAGTGLILDEVPAVGDLIFLSGRTFDPGDEEEEHPVEVSGDFRVLARQWFPAAWGSVAWSSGDRQSDPAGLMLLVERAVGLFDGVGSLG